MQNAVALGTFDGIHKGHLAVLNIPDSYNKTALIFKIPPKCIKKGVVELLLTPEEKVQRLKKLGFNVRVLDFSEVEHLTCEDFLALIKNEFNPALISCGFNYRFGYKGEGNTLFLESFCKDNGIILNIADPVKENGEIISSSVIRKALKEGELSKANSLLGYDFSFSADVIKGDGRGNKLGFPTINQRYPEKLTPIKFGVYKTEVLVDNAVFNGVSNIGYRPTFPTDYIISETFIKDFSGDLYGKSAKIILKEFLRSEQKFSSTQELRIQVLKDIGV